MSDSLVKLLDAGINQDSVQQIDHWIAKYPANEKQSAVMGALTVVQDQLGYLTQNSMDAIADYLEMPAIAVYEVASFYSMYETQPIGKHMIRVCTNISCQLRDSASILKYLEKKLAIKAGETTTDGQFTLRTVECLGACVNAPMMQVDKDYHENLSHDKIDTVLQTYE